MIHSIILDDNHEDALQLQEKIHSLSSKITTVIFHDLTSCKEYIEANEINVCFLDIEVNGEKSFTILNELKKDVIVVFISNYPSYAMDCFNLRTLMFIEKRFLDSKLKDVLLDIETLFSYKSDHLTFEKKGTRIEIPMRTILYLKKDKNYVSISYLTHNSVYTEYKTLTTLSEIQAQLPEVFIKIDRSVIINYYYIKSIDNEKIIMSDSTVLYISRRLVKEVHRQFFLLKSIKKLKGSAI